MIPAPAELVPGKGNVLGKCKGCNDPILDCAWTDESHFVTCGPKNYMYWSFDKKKDFKKPKLYPKTAKSASYCT